MAEAHQGQGLERSQTRKPRVPSHFSSLTETLGTVSLTMEDFTLSKVLKEPLVTSASDLNDPRLRLVLSWVEKILKPCPPTPCMVFKCETRVLADGPVEGKALGWALIQQLCPYQRGEAGQRWTCTRRMPYENKSENTQDGQKTQKMLRDITDSLPALRGKPPCQHLHLKIADIAFLLRPQLGLPCVAASDNKCKHPSQSFIPLPSHRWLHSGILQVTSKFNLEALAASVKTLVTDDGEFLLLQGCLSRSCSVSCTLHSRPQLKYLTSHF